MPHIMKNTYKYIFSIFCCIAIQSSVVAESSSLPLSQQEISKLQQLFPENNNPVSKFQEIVHEHVVWNQTPIDVILPVGKERMVSFPMSVEFGYDKSILSDDKLTVQNNNGTLYLFAKSSFPV